MNSTKTDQGASARNGELTSIVIENKLPEVQSALNTSFTYERNLTYHTGPKPITPLNLLRAVENVCEEVGSMLFRGPDVSREKEDLISSHTSLFLQKFKEIAALRLTPEDLHKINLEKDLQVKWHLLHGVGGDPFLTLTLCPSMKFMDEVLDAPSTLFDKKNAFVIAKIYMFVLLK